MATAKGKTVKVTQTGSAIGRAADQRKTLIGLGLNKMHRTRELDGVELTAAHLHRVRVNQDLHDGSISRRQLSTKSRKDGDDCTAQVDQSNPAVRRSVSTGRRERGDDKSESRPEGGGKKFRTITPCVQGPDFGYTTSAG